MTSTTGSEATAWVLNPLFMLRIGGLPVNTAATLRFPDSAAWADRVLAAEEALAAQRLPTAEALRAVATDVPADLRPHLVTLRRDVLNSRRPRNPDAVRAHAARLTDRARFAVLAWLETKLGHERLCAIGGELLADETEERRDRLREIAADPRLRHGLQLASPALDGDLDAYLDTPAERLDAHTRHIERSLLNHVYRAACKTSPFSTLTTVALGRFGACAPDALTMDGLGDPTRGHVRINVAALARLTDAVVADPELSADVPIELTSGFRAVDRKLRRGAGDDTGVPAGTVLRDLVSILDREPGLPMGELAMRLHWLDPLARERGTLKPYLHWLMRLGLLQVPALRIDVHSPDPLDDYRIRVASLDRPWARATAERLDTVSGHVAAYGEAGLTERRRLTRSIGDELGEIRYGLGAKQAALPRTLLHEDVSHPGVSATADLGLWDEGVLTALNNLTRILPLFDLTLPGKLALKGFFVARYGKGGLCRDLPLLVHEFHRDFPGHAFQAARHRRAFDADGEYVPQDNPLRLPEITELDEARRDLAARMRQARGSLPYGADELVLDDGFFDAVAARIPASAGRYNPYGFLLQTGDDGGRPLAVVNRIHSGLTLLFSRFAHCFDDAGLVKELRTTLEELQPGNAVFAELTEGHATANLSLHPPMTDYELVCPGDGGSVPEEARIAVTELEVVHDEAEGRLMLWSPRLGKEIIPVYLGLRPLALPETQRALLLFSPYSTADLSVWDGVDRLHGNASVRGRPRLRHRDLVLTRRTWTADPANLPRRGQDDAKWFLAWRRWQREHDLPTRVFVKIDTDRGEDDGDADAATAPWGKPRFFDFDSYFSLLLLDHFVHYAHRRVVFQEMLPDSDRLWLHGSDGAYVTEQAVEITQVRKESGRRPGNDGPS
ncbi:lantibiotic dehydratase [Rhizohabitans arisaemae]|uniref:lantibiotic dehydratase n=1 Tax=Rhizohabitans arisaemae TaxID=2720610 RepID=UPI0024B0C285|nr:lantibiotic dehydratase [Rhizohabitans arisaemae]